MTILEANDSTVICRTQLTGDGRWVSLSLSLGNLTPANRFLVATEHALDGMAVVGESAELNSLPNWQGGVISGARYTFRALKAPIQQVCLHELRGQLSGGDVWAVSAAAALAIARLLGRPEVPLDLGGWSVEDEVRPPPAAQGVSQRGKAVTLPIASPQGRVENLAPTDRTPATDRDTHDIQAEPAACADRPPD